MARFTGAALIFSAMVASGCGREQRVPVLAGGREVKSWIADLHDGKAGVRRQAVLKLGNVGDADPAAVQGLAAALRDADPLVRREAVFAVLKLKSPTQEIVQELGEVRRADRDATVRDLASRALEKLEQRP
jgi:HEAT repeat protein